MTLLEFSSSLDELDTSMTAYISRASRWSYSSEIILALEPDNGAVPSLIKGTEMDYFLEVFVAKEVVNSWESQISRNVLDPYSRSNLLIYYAENDAYPPKNFILNQ